MAKSDATIWAVVPAAGRGQRMRQRIPKQYLSVQGKTILEHSVSVLLSCLDIEQVVVCTAVDDVVFSTLNLDVINTLGGDTRAQSVLNGLYALPGNVEDDDWVLVHDAARPCVDSAMLQQFIRELLNNDVGGILAVPVKDTLKQASCEKHPRISATLDRATIWQAQTPQMFRFGLLKSALSSAIESQVDITDEASAVERAGYSPRIIKGDTRNLKITVPEDLALAELYFSLTMKKQA